jgi:hypothetical protein
MGADHRAVDERDVGEKPLVASEEAPGDKRIGTAWPAH